MRKPSIASLAALTWLLTASCAPVDTTGSDETPGAEGDTLDPTEVGAAQDDMEGADDGQTDNATSSSVESISFASGTRLRSPLNVSSAYSLISSHFRRNYRRYDCQSGSRQTHRGVDFAVPVGTSVYAAAAGRVIAVRYGCSTYGHLGSTCGGELGNHVIVLHSNGRATRYEHLKNTTPLVRVGQSVSCGQRIGYSGSSGSSSGPHLHFGVFDGASASDPYRGTVKNPFGGPCSTQSGTLWRSSTNRPTPSC